MMKSLCEDNMILFVTIVLTISKDMKLLFDSPRDNIVFK